MYGFPRRNPMIDQRGRRWYNGLPEPAKVSLWLRASDGVYANAEGSVPATDGDPVYVWHDMSGRGHHMEAINTTCPTRRYQNGWYLDTTTGYLRCSAPFLAQHIFVRFCSPTATWGSYGGPLVSSESRAYLLEDGATRFHYNPYPSSVRRNGSALASPYDLAPITTFFVAMIVSSTSTARTWNIDYWEYDARRSGLYIQELIAYSDTIDGATITQVESYLMRGL